MNLKGHYPASRPGPPRGDIERITAIWRECLWTASRDPICLEENRAPPTPCMRPVCTRFLTYDIALDPLSARYSRTIMALAPMQEWNCRRQGSSPTSSKSWTWSFDLRLVAAARYSATVIA